jgi:hypothetical protein
MSGTIISNITQHTHASIANEDTMWVRLIIEELRFMSWLISSAIRANVNPGTQPTITIKPRMISRDAQPLVWTSKNTMRTGTITGAIEKANAVKARARARLICLLPFIYHSSNLDPILITG